MLDKATVIDTVERYAEVVKKELSPSAVVLFGSCVNGTSHKDSDIDVGVVFNGFTGDWRQTASKLWRLRRGVSFDIEPHLLDSANDKSGFVKHVFKTGQIIYQA
jgi:predicted nucleotidyltransferase